MQSGDLTAFMHEGDGTSCHDMRDQFGSIVVRFGAMGRDLRMHGDPEVLLALFLSAVKEIEALPDLASTTGPVKVLADKETT